MSDNLMNQTLVSWKYDEEFLNNYKEVSPPWGPLGWVVYKRTYSRWIEEEGRSEQWWETCQRVLEGNYNLTPNDPTISKEDMEQAYDHMFNMRWLPAGRGLWISGTDTAAKIGAALTNCWNINIEPMRYYSGSPFKASTPFVFSMDRLMLGGGVGYNVSQENANKFNTITTKVDLVVVCDPKHPNLAELEPENIPPRNTNHLYIRVQDSRRGWTDALRVIIDASFKVNSYDRTIILDVSDIRPSGQPIKGFGGTSSGPGPLVRMLRAVNSILNASYGRRLTTVELSDIEGNIAKCVVSGNVRRSATLALGDVEDTSFATMKLDKSKLMEVRWTANISLCVDDSFTGYSELVSSIATNGEPGIVSLDRGRNYGRFVDGRQEGIDSEVDGVNPCSEVFLSGKGEPCNLAEIFPYFCYKDGVDPFDIIKFAFRYAKRVTFADYSDWEMTQEIVEKNRRVGISISGWDDLKLMFLAEGKDRNFRLNWLDQLYKKVVEEDIRYSELLGCNLSIKRTTIKPSGSISQLRGASPGRHAHYFAYGKRRIRFSDQDTDMLSMLRNLGFFVEEDAYSPNTYVVEFPVKSPTADLPNFKSIDEYTLEEQFEDQMDLQTYWADNSVSSTLTFKDHEVDQIPELLDKYKLKSTSLLPYSNHGYVQAPYEPISKEEYENISSNIIAWPSEFTFNSSTEKDINFLDDSDCMGGFCPVR